MSFTFAVLWDYNLLGLHRRFISDLESKSVHLLIDKDIILWGNRPITSH